MNFTGILLAIITFLIIGIFHPIVIWAEYRFSKRIWGVFALAGAVFLIISVFIDSIFISSIFAIISASCLWSIHELFEQEKRVMKGWFPKNPDRKY
ncbi:MAG: DUF4491 family protein [Ruminococcus sp.]|nr:DUF4491 family protein [Ruminococcus sp.]